MEPQTPPPQFEAEVREPGLRALARLVEVRGSLDAVDSGALPPLWRKCLPQLHTAYAGICAYVCVYIERVTGAVSTDHFVARSRDLQRAYDWDNYRLACSRMNARKGSLERVLDPFEIEDGWFELRLPGFQIQPRRDLPSDLRRRVLETIDALGLNDWDCRDLRCRHYLDYQTHRVDLPWLERESPFVARELRRLDALRPDDQDAAHDRPGAS